LAAWAKIEGLGGLLDYSGEGTQRVGRVEPEAVALAAQRRSGIMLW